MANCPSLSANLQVLQKVVIPMAQHSLQHDPEAVFDADLVKALVTDVLDSNNEQRVARYGAPYWNERPVHAPCCLAQPPAV